MKTTPARNVLLALVLLLPQPISPATLTVNGQTSDVTPGVCDLVEAVENANDDADTNPDCPGVGAYGDDTIELTLDVTLDTAAQYFQGPTGLPAISDPLEIEGNGFTIQRDPAAPEFRFMSVSNAATLTLRNTTLSGGQLPMYSPFGGGAIYADLFSAINVTDSSLSGNSSYAGGGAIFTNAGTTLTVTRSTLSGNTSSSHGGAVFVSQGSAEFTDSTLSGNSSLGGQGGGAIHNAGTSEAATQLTVTRSTLYGNATVGDGGAVSLCCDAVLTLENSTLSGNSSEGKGGALFLGESLTASSTITHSTLAGNTAVGGGAGIQVEMSAPAVKVAETLIANGGGGANCNGTVIDQGGNLADDLTCATIPDTLTGLDPALADNGGPTRTHALLSGSNAIDLTGSCGEPDQRGAAREGDCDSGAFEFLTCPDLVLSADSITDIETRSNCQNILVGPDLEVASNGDLTLRAGKGIRLDNGTSVETGGALALELDPDLQLLPPERTVFVTSITYQGNLGGLAGADDKCNARALAAGLPGSYKAWLSDDSCGPAQECRSFLQVPGVFLLVDGTVVADDWNDLVDGTLEAAISIDEFGEAATSAAWTATSADGTPTAAADDECNGWVTNNSLSNGWLGNPFATDSTWTDSISDSCNMQRALYCFEQ